MLIFSCTKNQHYELGITLDNIDTVFTLPFNKFYIHEIGYRNLQFNDFYDFSDKKLELAKVNSNDPFLKEIRKNSSSVEAFYYAVIDTTKYYSVTYYTQGDYEQCYSIVNYSKNGKIIDKN